MTQIERIDSTNVSIVSKLMSTIKPEWWDFDGAKTQLQDVSALAKLVGWCIVQNSEQLGWIACAEYEGYSCLSIESVGYNDNGNFVVDRRVTPLLHKAEKHAKKQGYRNLTHIISSIGMSCHDRQLSDYAYELEDLKSVEEGSFDCFVEYGFIPTGFIPNCYGKNIHGIVLIKSIDACSNLE